MNPADEPTKHGRSTLERAPTRALTFLLGAGRSPRIRAYLGTRGYTAAEHDGGWKLLRATDPSATRDEAGGVPKSDPAVREALARLDGWDNENLPIADLALRRREPKVHGYVFAKGLGPAEGIESVRVGGIFLDRIDAVRAVAEGGSRERVPFDATQAQAALVLLESRGLGATELDTVRGWLQTVTRGADPVAPTETPALDDGAALEALYEWVDEWSLVARKVLKRRADLISLGLVEKKSRKPKPADPRSPPEPAP